MSCWWGHIYLTVIRKNERKLQSSERSCSKKKEVSKLSPVELHETAWICLPDVTWTNQEHYYKSSPCYKVCTFKSYSSANEDCLIFCIIYLQVIKNGQHSILYYEGFQCPCKTWKYGFMGSGLPDAPIKHLCIVFVCVFVLECFIYVHSSWRISSPTQNIHSLHW